MKITRTSGTFFLLSGHTFMLLLFYVWLLKFSRSYISACTYIRIVRARSYIRNLLRAQLCSSLLSHVLQVICIEF